MAKSSFSWIVDRFVGKMDVDRDVRIVARELRHQLRQEAQRQDLGRRNAHPALRGVAQFGQLVFRFRLGFQQMPGRGVIGFAGRGQRELLLRAHDQFGADRFFQELDGARDGRRRAAQHARRMDEAALFDHRAKSADFPHQLDRHFSSLQHKRAVDRSIHHFVKRYARLRFPQYEVASRKI